ncbi:hypothetical protein D9757_012972 [Collybiopsis confluens]|uniref:Uncharacterized protein n=1 Tax=Collybiopsis confluens TaxID=2823264 RepID=A0A8H5LQ48_9AGAR|nr:hypothetical protein D9757_012972 [Collybiopsis confluens]
MTLYWTSPERTYSGVISSLRLIECECASSSLNIRARLMMDSLPGKLFNAIGWENYVLAAQFTTPFDWTIWSTTHNRDNIRFLPPPHSSESSLVNHSLGNNNSQLTWSNNNNHRLFRLVKSSDYSPSNIPFPSAFNWSSGHNRSNNPSCRYD